MYIKPAEGRAPRCPYTNLRIAAEGQEYPDHDPNIAALLRFGDVVEAEPPTPADSLTAPVTEAATRNRSARGVTAVDTAAPKPDQQGES